jgi:hypothetical protein
MQEALRRVALGTAFGLVVLSLASPTRAAHACAGAPWVAVVVPEAGGSHELRAEIVRQVRAGLQPRGIDVCAPGEPHTAAPIARVELASPAGRVVAIEVVAEDAITAKRLSREIDLSNLPRDAWALTLALAIDEILRASWAELALESAPPPARPVPAEVEHVVRDSLRAEPSRRDPTLSLGTALVGESYAGGQQQLGVDARAGIWLMPRVELHVSVGLRDGLAARAEHGEVSSSALVGGLGIGVTATEPSAELGVDLIARVQASRFKFHGSAEALARARSESGTGLAALAGAGGWLLLGEQVRLGLELLVGSTLVAVRATDDGERVTAASGLAASAALSLSGVF